MRIISAIVSSRLWKAFNHLGVVATLVTVGTSLLGSGGVFAVLLPWLGTLPPLLQVVIFVGIFLTVFGIGIGVATWVLSALRSGPLPDAAQAHLPLDPTPVHWPTPTPTPPVERPSAQPVAAVSEGRRPAPKRTRLADGRLAYNVAPRTLTGLYENKTSAQGDREAAVWIGRLMVYSGPVNNHRQHGTSATVSFDATTPEQSRLIFARFTTPETIEQVAVLNKGDHVTVVGRISEIQIDQVILEDAEVVEL